MGQLVGKTVNLTDEVGLVGDNCVTACLSEEGSNLGIVNGPRMNADALLVAFLNVISVELDLGVLGVRSKCAEVLGVVPSLNHVEAVKGSYESLGVNLEHTSELLVVEGGVDNEVEHTGLLSESVESSGHLGVSGLDLYVTNHIVLAAEVEEVFHKGKLGALEVGGELAAEVEVKELLVGVLGNERKNTRRKCGGCRIGYPERFIASSFFAFYLRSYQAPKFFVRNRFVH